MLKTGAIGTFSLWPFPPATPTFETMATIVARNIGKIKTQADCYGARIVAGANLGADLLPGGSGDDADTYLSGSVESLKVGGNFNNSLLVAGATAGGVNTMLPGGYDLFNLVLTDGFVWRSTVGKVKIVGDFAASAFGGYGIGAYEIVKPIVFRSNALYAGFDALAETGIYSLFG